MPEQNLPNEVQQQIEDLYSDGLVLAESGQNPEAWQKYVAALNLIPEPEYEWEITTKILVAMGDLRFRKPDFGGALQVFQDAVRCPGGLGDVFIHLRLGQCYFELGDEQGAADNLTRAYMGGGREAFEQEDPKYLALLERILKPPAGQNQL